MAYAREGAKLALCARTGSELEQTVKEIQALKNECKGWSCDVSLEEPVRDFVGNVVKLFGRIDVLVNNAGVMTRPVAIAELEVKKWDYTIAVNLRGPFLVTQAVLPIMMKRKAARSSTSPLRSDAALTPTSSLTRLPSGAWKASRRHSPRR
jgi:3-oxoacyl-[acyl-carrier protein] reductase